MAQQAQAVMPTDMVPQLHHPPLNAYYPENPNDLTGGLPMNLDSLRDGPPGSKPFYPYSTLIRYAIKGAPNQKLLLEDIYYAIESRFPYFRSAPPGWKNSVRHNLSLNPCFEKVPRPLTDRGKGSYWTVNDNVDPRTGVHRVRKKKPKGSGKRGEHRLEDDIDYHPGGSQEPTFHDASFVPPPIRPVEEGPSAHPQPPPPPPTAYPPPQYAFDPNFSIMPPPPGGIRYQPQLPPLFPPDEQFETDEHGNINWQAAWLKELSQLQQLTEEQQKAGADQEWYRMMLFRVRSAMVAPPMNPGDPAVHIGAPPPRMPGQPPNQVEIPQEQ
ncbi:hypothetical protein POSPLADRAFT_1048658 [Postia placenta MAD-698-R-SB12]|uniref:Fork-head domain-containing protein n=1 Tax=Postia placenta MAD-698-R-SB12 TaxID=670580 RepID=A0A1X6MSN6_9APHY|nr:hypothetical protein POSPLADRAFT_1048658 [Postia placenta MAD-698-R-SB12]OSX59319.1 hypothetical protein POSPLADRAFT_1048658 [Postia placenta MAD-698-R-SB12]